MQHGFTSYVAIGDSFTEGVGDELPGGGLRGWADLVAQGLALASSTPVTYANLAIRGRLLAPIIAEQSDAAIALRPALISLNGGGNDMLRPRVDIASIADAVVRTADKMADSGAHVLLLSGANPSRHIPLGRVFQRRGDRLDRAVRELADAKGMTFVDNWADTELADIRFWSRDRLHLNSAGHARVAGSVLEALQVRIPDAAAIGLSEIPRPRTAEYWREYVLPWIGRRLTGRSSGDGREPKIAVLTPVELP